MQPGYMHIPTLQLHHAAIGYMYTYLESFPINCEDLQVFHLRSDIRESQLQSLIVLNLIQQCDRMNAINRGNSSRTIQ